MYLTPRFCVFWRYSLIFANFYHNLVNGIRISALCYQSVAESKQSIEDIPPLLCCEVKVILPFSHTKITSALTVSVTADRRLLILPTHSIWLSAFQFFGNALTLCPLFHKMVKQFLCLFFNIGKVDCSLPLVNSLM